MKKDIQDNIWISNAAVIVSVAAKLMSVYAVLLRWDRPVNNVRYSSIISLIIILFPDLESHLECNLEKLKATVPPHVRFTRSYAEVVRARQQQAQQVRAQAQRNVIIGSVRSVGMN